MKTKSTFLICFFCGIISTFAQIPTKGLVLYMPLNGNAIDSSSFSNNGTCINTALVNDRFGKAHKAMSFNGYSSYIQIPASQSLNLPFNKSISYWIYIPSNISINNYSTVIYKDEPVNGSTYRSQLNQEAGHGVNRYKISNAFTSGTSNYGSVTKQLFNNYTDQWIHIAGTYDSISGYSKIYFNGVISDSTYIGNKSSNPSNLDLFIGCGKNNSYLSQTYFTGGMDDIRIYNRALNSKEVSALFDERQPITSTDTTTYYVTGHEYIEIGSVLHFTKSDSLTSRSTGGDSIINHYARFEYSENIKSVSVTDTMIIKLNITGIAPDLSTENIIKIYPNSTKDNLFIDFGEYSKMQGYVVMIRDVSDKLVSLTSATQKLVQLDMKLWSGKGTYVIQILDSQNKLVDTRKVILE